MKQVIYKLIGEKSGRVIVGTWHWLWGIPVESGGKIAVEVAQESLESMQRSVAELTESVAHIMSAYQLVKSEYDLKQKEYKEAENQAILAYQNGNEDAARLAISKAIALENLLPKIASKVEQSEQVLTIAKQKLQKEKEQLELHKMEMQNLKSLHKINESLATITDFDSSLNIESAQSQFDDASQAIKGRNLKINAEAELSENPTDKLQGELNQMTIDAEIKRRFELLKKQR
ncbi:MAG TPA: PspA/IM30 family protein [Allocoleopsis sp.]